MIPSEIVKRRLQNQLLTNTHFKRPAEVISWMGGIQGQDYAGAKWGIGLRLNGSKDVDVENSLAEKTILRTWLMRGTLHLVTTEDIRWMVELLAPRIIKRSARRYQELGLDENTFKNSNQILKDALENCEELKRSELLEILRNNRISTDGQRAPHILQRASLEGLICQCGVERNNPIYMSMDSVPKIDMSREKALKELARRYFQSRGPATIGDFIWWSGLLAADARAGLEAIKEELKCVKVNNNIYWYPETSICDSKSIVHLLPTYDEYIFSYKDRSEFISEEAKIKLGDRYRSMIALNGQIIGTWKRTLQKNHVFMEYFPFKTMNMEEKHLLDKIAHRYGEFLDLNVVNLDKD